MSSIFNTLLSGFIFLRNPKNRLNQVFGIFGVIVVVWTIFNFSADNAQTNNLLFTRLTLFFGASVIATLFMLCTLFPRPKPYRRSWSFFYGFTALTLLLCLTPYFVQSVTKTSHGAELQVGSLYSWFSLYVLVGIIWSLLVLLRHSKARNIAEKSQVRLFAIGIFIYTTSAFLSNVILPLVVNNWSSSRLGPIFTVPFVAVTAYAIVKHRLFDIRLAITRTIGFVVTISAVAAVYSLIILVVAPFVTQDNNISNLRLLLFIPPTIFVALTFHSVQQYVAKLTRRVFYHDSYDLREVLDKLSDTLITDYDISKIMSRSLSVISSAIKPSHATFIVLDDQGKIYRQLVEGRAVPAQLDVLLGHTQVLKDRVLVQDELSAGKWRHQLEQDDVALLLRLGTTKSTIGALFFGPKQNGQIYTKQDVDLLNISSKNLGIALENAKKYEQIANFAETMHKEVLRATAGLRQANKELKTLDALKDDFISMASHQLRSPATSVHEAIKMITQNPTSPEEQKRILELAEASSERLVGVVVDMLSIARIQAGHFNIEKQELDLSALVERAMLEASVLAQQKEIKIEFNKPKEPVKAFADRAKINETMANYIENAIKYNEKGGAIKIDLRSENGRIIFEVQDNGIGVPEEERKNLFGKFFRAKNARVEQPDGNGIGLFVVKTIAKSHGGDAYYKPLDKGSVFGFWLPADSK